MSSLGTVRRYVGGSLARQLVLGVAVVQALLISLFIFDLVSRQAVTLSESRTERAEGVAGMLATSGVSWVLSEDLHGLDELTRSAAAFDGLRYAMFVSPSGRVLAHSDAGVAGRYLADARGRSLRAGAPGIRQLALNDDAVDVAVPITSNHDGRLIGWAWVSLSRADVTAATRRAVIEGVSYVVLATAFAALISGVLARNVAQGLAHLADVSHRFESGDRRVRVQEKRLDEVGATGRGLNRMLDAVVDSEAALRRREDALATVQRIARLGAWRQDVGRPAVWTQEVYAMFGIDPEGPPLTQDGLLAAVRAEDRDNVASILVDTSRNLVNFQFALKRPDGEQRVCWAERRLERDGRGEVIAVTGVCQDITDREAAAAQLRQAQKMEAVGQLTGGLAHDFNNLLSVIIGNLDFIEGELEDGSPVREFSQTALAAALKGSELTQQLLAFSRCQPLDPKLVDLNQLVFGMTSLWKRTLGDNIDVRLEQSFDLRLTTADQSQVESALLNLAVNARDAMPSGGVLTIETVNITLDEESVAGRPDLLPGDYAVVSVSDTGVGMPADVLAKVFDPFFTTKEIGKGSGLGLSMVYGFAKQSGGHVVIYSEVGHGTTVRLFLPAATRHTPRVKADRPTPAATPRSRKETVLVVEDSEGVRQVAIRQLRDLGYRVLEADNAAAALEVMRNNPEIHLLFTDIVMPGGMSGIELVGTARSDRPALKVLYATGFTESAAGSTGFTGPDLLIRKPYRKTELAQKLREALEA